MNIKDPEEMNGDMTEQKIIIDQVMMATEDFNLNQEVIHDTEKIITERRKRMCQEITVHIKNIIAREMNQDRHEHRDGNKAQPQQGTTRGHQDSHQDTREMKENLAKTKMTKKTKMLQGRQERMKKQRKNHQSINHSLISN